MHATIGQLVSYLYFGEKVHQLMMDNQIIIYIHYGLAND